MKKTILICSLCLLFTFGDLNAKEEKPEPEVFTCSALLTTTMAAGATARLTISIDSYTPKEEIIQYINILKKKGPRELRITLEKVKRGWVARTGRVSEDFSIARTFPLKDGGRLINILKTRSLKFIEFAYHTRSTEPLSSLNLIKKVKVKASLWPVLKSNLIKRVKSSWNTGESNRLEFAT